MVTLGSPAEASPQLPQRQYDAIMDAQRRHPLKVGEVWYLVPAAWYTEWVEYCQGGGSKPGPIDTTGLFDENGDLRFMSENEDYILVNEQAWDLFSDWYDVTGDKIKRTVISQEDDYTDRAFVEVYPMKFVIVDTITPDEGEDPKLIAMTSSRTKTCVDLVTEIAALVKQPVTGINVWNYADDIKEELLNENRKELGVVMLTDSENKLFVELVSASKKASPPAPIVAPAKVVDDGLTGLMNLGNTCFMNSSLQCLSNIPPLAEYMLSGKYKDEINEQNPIGTGGHLAAEFARLIEQLWSGNHRSVAPRNFKMTLARFAPRFSGYQQQDSQELLAFLLDGIHEDLNRIHPRPYVEVPDADDRPHHEQAADAWRRYRKRDDSVIVDNFQGQYKSTVVCPECNKVSVTFDPFMYLTLPFPPKQKKYKVLFWGTKVTAPQELDIVVSQKAGKVSALVDAISTETGVPAEKLFLCEVFNSQVYQTWHPKQPLSDIGSGDEVSAFVVDEADVFKIEPASRYSYSAFSSKQFTIQADATRTLAYLVFRDPSIETAYYRNTRPWGKPRVLNFPIDGVAGVDLYAQVAEFLDVDRVEPVEMTDDAGDDGEGSGVMVDVPPPVKMDTDTDDEAVIVSLSEKPAADGSVTPMSSDADGDTDAGSGGASTDAPPPPPPKAPYPFTLFVSTETRPSYGGRNEGKLVAYTEDNVKLPLFATIAVEIGEGALKDAIEARSTVVTPSPTKTSAPTLRQDTPSLALQDCIRRFMMPERLGEDDMWYCPQCKERRQATKQMELYKLPRVIVFNLKRFSYDRYRRDKIDTVVNFPLEGLDLSEFLQSPDSGEPAPLYDCVAVSNHFGGLGGGHYTAFAKNRNDGQWYDFDDSRVSSVSVESIVSRSAYCLFYVRRE